MAEKIFQIEIATPQKYEKYENAVSCSAPGVLGHFQILVNHAPFVSQMDVGEMRVDTTDEILHFATSGGFIQVLDNNVLFLLDSCESSKEIDVQRAESAKERAKTRLEAKEADIDLLRAKLAFSRALNRLRISGKFSQRA
jgi:F-type H+-transporting ATPase subunit epsilon